MLGPDGRPRTLSWSAVSQYLDCPKKFQLETFDPEARAGRLVIGAGLGGSAIHEAIELSELNGWYLEDKDTCLSWLGIAFMRDFSARLNKETDRVGPEGIYWGGRSSKEWPEGETADWWAVNWQMFARRYRQIKDYDAEEGISVVTTREADPETGELSESLPWVEKRVTWNLTREDSSLLPVSGKVDVVVVEDPEVGWIIRDWKTGRYLEPLQLAWYARLIELAGGPNVDWGEFAWLRGTSLPGTMLQRYDLRAWKENIVRTFMEADNGIRKEVFPINPGSFCKSCTVRRFCYHGRTLEETT